MSETPHTSTTAIDVRALGELRRIAMSARFSNDERGRRIDALEAEVARLRTELEAGTARAARLTQNNQELTQALQQAQSAYLDAVDIDDTSREPTAGTAAVELRRLRGERDKLAAQMSSITGSRAWKAVNGYRRLVKKLRP